MEAAELVSGHGVKRLLFVGTTSVLMFCGCLKSRASMTAGQVGCLPGEIEVHSESWTPAWGGGTETWIAECQGRTYVCSEVKSAVDQGSVSQVSCAEHGGDDDGPSDASAAHAPHSAPPAAPKAAPPAAGAGFTFGASAEEARTACETSGNTWQAADEKSATCSGTAVALGFPATVTLAFCKDRLCAIVIQHRPESEWLDPLTELRSKLEEKYGKPETRSGSIPADCRSRAEFAKCVEKELRLSYEWTWSTGELIILSVGKPEGAEGDAAIRIRYTRPFRSVSASSSAL